MPLILKRKNQDWMLGGEGKAIVWTEAEARRYETTAEALAFLKTLGTSATAFDMVKVDQ